VDRRDGPHGWAVDKQRWEQALQEPWVLSSCEQVWTEGMALMGGLFQCNGFVLPQIVLSLPVHVKHQGVQILF